MKKYRLVLWNPKPFEQEITERIYPPMSLGIIASMTPSNWEVVIRDEFFEAFKTETCDLVAVTAMTCQSLNAYKIAEVYRKLGIPVIMGGIHATVCTDEAIQYVNTVIKGEVEEIWEEIIKDVEATRLKQIYSAGKLASLEKVPCQSFELYNPNYKWGIIQTTRGCAANCEFCAVTAIYGATYRKRPLEAVLDEIQGMPQKQFFIADDNLIGFSKEDHQRFKDLCMGMIKRKLNKLWIAQVPVQFSDDSEMLNLAHEAGCRGVLIGIESGSLKVLSGKMNKRMNVKYIEKGKFTREIQKHGIQTFGSFVIGNDEDDATCFKTTYNIIHRLGLAMAHAGPLIPYPGTRLFERLKKENRLLYTNFPHDWKYYKRSQIILYMGALLTDDEMKEGTLWLWKKLFSMPAVLSRVISSFLNTGDFKTAMTVFRINAEWRMLYKECCGILRENIKVSRVKTERRR